MHWQLKKAVQQEKVNCTVTQGLTNDQRAHQMYKKHSIIGQRKKVLCHISDILFPGRLQ